MSVPVAAVVLGVLFGVAAIASVGQVVAVSATAIRSRTLPDLADEIPWGTAGLGLLGGVAASVIARGLAVGALSAPSDLTAYLLVLAVGGWGFGAIHAAASSKWELRPAWLIAPIIATTVLGVAVGLLSQAWR